MVMVLKETLAGERYNLFCMKKYLLIISFLFSFVPCVHAQWVNNEQIIVQPNTILYSNESFTNTTSGSFLNDGVAVFAKNINNDGAFTFTSTQKGITYFQGMGLQQITGQSILELNQTVFSNPQGFELSTTLNFHQSVDFNEGILTVEPNFGIAIFETNATASNTNNSSFILGKTFKKGTTDFQFPIGKGTKYRSATISGIHGSNQVYSGEFFDTNSNNLYPHANRAGIIKEISTTEYWEVSNVGGTAEMMLTLSFENATPTDAIIREPLEALRIVRWDVPSQKWVDEGGIVDKDKLTITTPYNVSGFSIFTIGRMDDVGIVSPCNKLAIYNYISPNEDGWNDYFRIDGLVECAITNTVEIYNRWGRKVYTTQNYGSASNVFKGVSNCNSEVAKTTQLPPGTYYYVLKIGTTFSKLGYLFIN